jgi:hypothetical protein
MIKEAYFSHPAISNSKLGLFKQSPKHYKYFEDHVKKETPQMLIGTATHTILFEPEKLMDIFFLLDYNKRPDPSGDYRKTANKQWKEDMISLNAGKELLSMEDYDMIMFMQQELNKNELAVELFKGAQFETEVYFKDQVFGMGCRCKIDGKKPGLKFDYKTTDNADPWRWQKKAWGLDYYRQAAFYTDSDDNHEEFWFIAQEKTAPYAISVHKCTQEMLDYGRGEYIKLLTHLKACKDTDTWPGYEIKNMLVSGNEYFDFDVPTWAQVGL